LFDIVIRLRVIGRGRFALDRMILSIERNYENRVTHAIYMIECPCIARIDPSDASTRRRLRL
jgi:hypothetical protein